MHGPPPASEHANCPESRDLFFNETVTLGRNDHFYKDGYGILLHLLVFGVLALVGLATYWARLRWGWEEREAAAPSLGSVLGGGADDWVRRARGQAALDYLAFDRLMLLLALVVLAFSTISLAGNMVEGNQGHAEEAAEGHIFTRWINTTTLSSWNLGKERSTSWYWYHVVASFLLPLVTMAIACRLLPNCFTDDQVQGCTVVVQGLNPDTHTPTVIREYFGQRYPAFSIR